MGQMVPNGTTREMYHTVWYQWYLPMVLPYQKKVPTNGTGTRVPNWYTCAYKNIISKTKNKKQLEIQALRCNGDTGTYVRTYHGTSTIYRG